MSELIKMQPLMPNFTNRYRDMLICTVCLMILGGGAFNHCITAQTPAAASADKVQSAPTADQKKADKLIAEASGLQKQNTNAAKRRAIEKYKRAAKLLRNDELPQKFIALDGIADIYKELNESDRAVEYWRQALATLRAGKNRKPEVIEAEAGTLLQIGVIYDERGDGDKALRFYWQALDLTRDSRSYAAAGALNGIIQLHLKANQPERAHKFLEDEIARARVAKDAETEKGLTEILNRVKNGTINK